MTPKAITAKTNTAQGLQEKGRRAGACGSFDVAAESYLRAAKLFSETGDRKRAEHAWRRACDFSEREANRVFQQGQRNKLN